VQVRDGKYDGLEGLDPAVSWSNSAKTGDVDLEYGIEASARPTTDLASLPKSVWGKASTDVSGWGVSARAEVDAQARENADLEVNAVNEANDVSVKMVASAGRDFNVQSVEAVKGFNSGGGRVTVNPRYNMESEEADVVVQYNKDKTNVKLTASTDSQEVTISQQINDDNRVAPTLASNGDMSVEWERKLGDDNSLTATLKPNDSLDLKWKDEAWTANINMPIDGASIEGANVSIKREIKF